MKNNELLFNKVRIESENEDSGAVELSKHFTHTRTLMLEYNSLLFFLNRGNIIVPCRL